MTERASGGHPPKMGTIAGSSCARWGGGSVLALMLACGEPSAPYEGDLAAPASGWLAACSSDGECGPDARCLRGMCTVACDAAQLGVCTGVNADAVCDTTLSACDVPCGVALACQVLGSGYVCDEGRCRSLISSR